MDCAPIALLGIDPLPRLPFGDATALLHQAQYQAMISLRYSFYGGWRNVKILSSGECRKIHNCCIFRARNMLNNILVMSK